jgi:hypothetical protein
VQNKNQVVSLTVTANDFEEVIPLLDEIIETRVRVILSYIHVAEIRFKALAYLYDQGFREGDFILIGDQMDFINSMKESDPEIHGKSIEFIKNALGLK